MMRHSILIAPLLVVCAAAYPIFCLFIHGVRFFDIGAEFIAYRIGDALSLMFGEAGHVHPVQGIPTALLSKGIVYALFSIYDRDLLTPPVVQLYSAIFFGVVFLLTAVMLGFTWQRLGTRGQMAAALLALVPWYIGGPSISLLSSPEYWLGEYAFLICSLAGLLVIGRSGDLSSVALLAVGAWVGFGIAIKITLLGIAPIFFLALPRRGWRQAALMIFGAGVAYVVLVAAYAGFAPRLTASMLVFQLFFYLHPNESATYKSLWAAFAAQPVLVYLLAILGLFIVWMLWRRHFKVALATIMWLLVYAYLAWRRPHDTSLASAALSITFLIAYLLSFMPMKLGAATIAISCVAFLYSHPSPAMMWIRSGPSPALPEIPNVPADRSTAWFIPSNDWTISLPLQAWGYNGGLGLFPVVADAAGRPRYSEGGKAFSYFFGANTVIIGETDATRYLVTGLKNGTVVRWTRPVAQHNPTLDSIVREAGAEVTETKLNHHGREMLVGAAEVTSR